MLRVVFTFENKPLPRYWYFLSRLQIKTVGTPSVRRAEICPISVNGEVLTKDTGFVVISYLVRII